MKCPMTFGNPCSDRDEECCPDCAWLVRYGEAEACAIAKMACTGMLDHKWRAAMPEYIITSVQLEAIAKQLRELYGEWFDPDTEHPMFEGDPLPVLVRCRDCKHAPFGTCKLLKWRSNDYPVSVAPSFFCGRGERKERP